MGDWQTNWGDCEYFRYIKSLAVDPADSSGLTVYVGTSGRYSNYFGPEGAIFKTADGGDTWEKMNGGNNFDLNVVDIKFDPQDDNIMWTVTSLQYIDGDEGTLYRSEDRGATWSAVYNSVDGAFSVVEVKPNDSNTVFTGSRSGLRKHSFDGTNWITVELYGQVGGWLDDIAFDPGDPATMYVTWKILISDGGDGIGKVSKSTDGGNTWVRLPDHEYRFMTLTVHPADSTVLIASDYYEGIFKSQDSGQTWTPISEGLNAVIVYDVAVDPQDSNHILAGTISGIYANKNKGAGEWLRRTNTLTKSILFNPANSQRIYAGIKGYVIKSLDGGVTWPDQYSSNLLGNGIGAPNDIAIDPDTNWMYIAVSDYLVYRSENEGSTFSAVLLGVNQDGEYYSFNAVAIDPANTQRVFAGGGNYFSPKVAGDLWLSDDGGGTWLRTSLQSPPDDGDPDTMEPDIIINDILINPSNSQIMYAGAGYSGGTNSLNDEYPLYKSTDGGITWAQSSDGIPQEQDDNWNAVTDLDVHKTNRNIIYAATNGQGVYVSDQAQAWLHLGTPVFDVFAIAVSSVYGATQGGLMQLTGTGVIAGQIINANSQSGINNATVFSDLGSRAVSVNGSYIMVSPSGNCSLTAVANNHENKTETHITVYGGDVTTVNFSMDNGVFDPSVVPGGAGSTSSETNVSRSSGSGGGKVCFIATAAYGSPMAGQVMILRQFRDKYLLPYTSGRNIVNFYYRNGKLPADFIKSHGWLKSPVRVLLYPIIGFAWLMLSTSATGKFVIGLCFLSGFVIIFRKKIAGRNEK
jgi:photosystem II stability/assembly factor-like uncharacterized protein